MQWTDNAIILSLRKHGENSAVARVFTLAHGVYGGVVKYIHSKANRGMLQPGNIVSATWNARLSEHLGVFRLELMEPVAAHLMNNAMELGMLTSACALISSALPERHPYERLYDALTGFLHGLKSGESELEDYVRLEMEILAESGFGLDLSQCAATGATEDLIYVSPKSGRAVSREAGEPYKERLLKLPSFLVKALPLEGGGLGGGDLTLYARELRKNQTDVEKKLWQYLSQKQLEGHKFRRQHPMGGKYIVDFICLEQRLIIELDGGQHAQQQAYDALRTVFLEAEGYRLLRFWNHEVMENIEGVWIAIQAALSLPVASPPPNPPPSRGRGNNVQDLLAGLELTGYFLANWLLEPHNRKLPAARTRLIQKLKESNAAEIANA